MPIHKIWLTGSRGFIGSVLARLLKNAGREVSCFSNQLPGKSEAPAKEFLCHTLDYLSERDIKSKVERIGLPDCFIHSGWGDMALPESAMHLGENLQASKTLIETLFRLGLKKFVFIGSMNEYGSRTGLLCEDSLPQGRLTNYAKAKIEVAKFGLKSASAYGKTYVHVRTFYVYGAGQRPGSLINELYQSFLLNKDVQLSPCEHYRDYIHVSEAGEGLLKISNSVEGSTVVNLGRGTVIKVKDFVLLFWKLLGGDREKLKFGARPMRSDEPAQPQSYADVTHLKNLIHWSPSLSLRDGIKRTIKELHERA
ncbi:MAG: NAD(P)-dependent oxidoreductase [Candidatus Omnitrophota bacterium]|jgi:nucleoside-diphosphate-sugar epimerase